uniref:DUF2089 domain-containing protein n=1 Tax=Candidatus Fimivicinus sp. TaxID=3056640 RepID=UPI003FF0D9B7
MKGVRTLPHEIIGTCPVCGEKLSVTQLSCRQCGTQISGDFVLSKFNALNREELAFAETFLRVQGSIREMEKELGISYPTVKKNLETIIRKMGFEVKKKSAQQEVLEKIRNGELTVDEAITQIKTEQEGQE